MTKEQAIELVRKLTEATVRHHRAVNEPCRLNPDKCAAVEFVAARNVLDELMGEPAKDEEIESALNW